MTLKTRVKRELRRNPAFLQFVGLQSAVSRGREGPRGGGSRRPGVGRAYRGAQVPRPPPAASPRGPRSGRGTRPIGMARQPRTPRPSRGGRAGVGAQSAALTSPSPPTASPQRAPPPTCHGKERSARAARKRRSKLCSRREASAFSSGAIAGGAAVELRRPGGSGEAPKGGEPEAVRGLGAGPRAGPGGARPQGVVLRSASRLPGVLGGGTWGRFEAGPGLEEGSGRGLRFGRWGQGLEPGASRGSEFPGRVS